MLFKIRKSLSLTKLMKNRQQHDKDHHNIESKKIIEKMEGYFKDTV